jgi:alkyl hydroperoxide reductase subunit F
MYDLLIIGSGPAGVAAAVYAARKRLKTVLIAEEVGGQSTVSEGIENWIGIPKIAGAELAKAFTAHLDAVKGDVVTITNGERVTSLKKDGEGFTATTKSGKEFSAKAVLIASGASRRKLTIPDADTFENKGLTYCASCDGPLFGGADVVVVGGGNAGLETALQLLAYCKSVTLLSRGELRADAVTIEKAKAHPNFKVITNAMPTEIKGSPFVTSVLYESNGQKGELAVTGVFVEIGVLPNTDFAADLIELDSFKRIKTDQKNQHTSVDGIWAAGDCTDELYHQNNIAAGDGVKALEDIYLWIKKQ